MINNREGPKAHDNETTAFQINQSVSKIVEMANLSVFDNEIGHLTDLVLELPTFQTECPITVANADKFDITAILLKVMFCYRIWDFCLGFVCIVLLFFLKVCATTF